MYVCTLLASMSYHNEDTHHNTQQQRYTAALCDFFMCVCLNINVCVCRRDMCWPLQRIWQCLFILLWTRYFLPCLTLPPFSLVSFVSVCVYVRVASVDDVERKAKPTFWQNTYQVLSTADCLGFNCWQALPRRHQPSVRSIFVLKKKKEKEKNVRTCMWNVTNTYTFLCE